MTGRNRRTLLWTLVALAATLLGLAAPPGAAGAQTLSVASVSGFSAVAVTFGSSCVVANGKVACWSGSTVELVPGITDAVDIAGGQSFTCVRRSGGTVSCWGANDRGQLGYDGADSPTPVTVAGLSNVIDLDLGAKHACAVVQSGSVLCWGDNTYGILGDGTSTQRATPAAVTGITTAERVAAGQYSTCAQLSTGEVTCWGNNAQGYLGNGTQTNSLTPVPTSVITDATDITLGLVGCVIENSAVRCWGKNSAGAVGKGDTASPVTTPGATAIGVTNPIAIDATYDHACAVEAAGTVKCWGENFYGQIGDGGTTPSPGTTSTPSTVTGVTNAIDVAAGDHHSCAISATEVKCWGRGVTGGLGPNGTGVRVTTPVIVDLSALDLSGGAAPFSTMAGTRVFDSRPGGITADGQHAGSGALAAGTATTVTVGGRLGIPADADTVAVNLTVTGASGAGYATLYPCAGALPTVSSINFGPGQTVANLAVSQLSGGQVCVFVAGADAHVILDIEGYWPTGSSLVGVTPSRLYDSRAGSWTADGLQLGGGQVAADSQAAVVVAGRAGVPADAEAVAVNVTVTNATGWGFVSVFACGQSWGGTSNLNFQAGDTKATTVLTKVGANGSVCALVAGAATDLVVDVAAYSPAGQSDFNLLDAPQRMFDTRGDSWTVDGAHLGAGPLANGTVVELPLATRLASVDDASRAAVLTLTATGSNGAGFVTVYPCGTERPAASSLNYDAGQTVANSVIVPTGTNGTVCLYVEGGTTHLVADLTAALAPLVV